MTSRSTHAELQQRIRELEARIAAQRVLDESGPTDSSAPIDLPGSEGPPGAAPGIRVAGIDIAWDTLKGTCTFEQLPVAPTKYPSWHAAYW